MTGPKALAEIVKGLEKNLPDLVAFLPDIEKLEDFAGIERKIELSIAKLEGVEAKIKASSENLVSLQEQEEKARKDVQDLAWNIGDKAFKESEPRRAEAEKALNELESAVKAKRGELRAAEEAIAAKIGELAAWEDKIEAAKAGARKALGV